MLFVHFILGFEDTMLSAVANIQTQQTQMLLALNELVNFNKKVSLENLIEPENVPNFPLKTLDEFLDFEKLLYEDEMVKQYMVSEIIIACFLRFTYVQFHIIGEKIGSSRRFRDRGYHAPNYEIHNKQRYCIPV